MLHDIAFAVWFLLPAAAANAAPIITAPLPFLNRLTLPLDFGKTWRRHRIFGSHKTWRGLISGIVVATLVLWLQQLAASHFGWAHWLTSGVNYTAFPTPLFGPALAIGALGGDAIESFFKRQRGIKSGRSWLPFDQLDYIIGSIIVSLGFIVLEPVQYLWMVIVWFLMHLFASYVGYKVGLKKAPI